MATSNPPLNASESTTVYESRVPVGIRPGQVFEVQLPDGNSFKVTCPPGFAGGEAFRIIPFQVVIPEGVRQNRRIFVAMVNGQQVSVRAPNHKHAGDTMYIHYPVFSRDSASLQPGPPKKPKPSSTFSPEKWGQYLNDLKKTTPGLDPAIVSKVHDIDIDTVPNEFVCPITTEIIMDPVVAVDGHTYEREAIEKWFQGRDTSPKTNEKLPSKILIPNRAIRSQIIDFIEHYQPPTNASSIETDSGKRMPAASFIIKN